MYRKTGWIIKKIILKFPESSAVGKFRIIYLSIDIILKFKAPNFPCWQNKRVVEIFKQFSAVVLYLIFHTHFIIVSDYLSEIGNHLLDSLLLSFEKKLQQRGDSLSAWTNICNCRKSTKYKEREPERVSIGHWSPIDACTDAVK